MNEMEIENKLALILAKVYIKIPWSKINTKSAHSFFVNRVEASAGALNIRQFIESLKKRTQVDFIDVNSKIIDYVDNQENRPYALRLLRKETNYIVLLALENVNEMKEQKKLNKKLQDYEN